MSKTRWFVFTMLQPILCRIFYHPNTETALLVACGHMESLTETKSCSLAWRILTNNIRDPLPSEQAERRCMSICNAEQAACRTYGVPLLGAALDSKGGYHQWRHQSLITKKSSHWHSPVYLATAFPFCLSLSFFFFFQFFWSWSPPLALWHVLPSVHADGAIQRSQKVCCPQIPLDSVGSLYHRAVGKTNEKLENTFQSTKQSRLI